MPNPQRPPATDEQFGVFKAAFRDILATAEDGSVASMVRRIDAMESGQRSGSAVTDEQVSKAMQANYEAFLDALGNSTAANRMSVTDALKELDFVLPVHSFPPSDTNS